MIKSTEYLHNAIRSGIFQCVCPEWTKMEREVRHLPGCRWQAYVEEIYRLEREAEGGRTHISGRDIEVTDHQTVYL